MLRLALAVSAALLVAGCATTPSPVTVKAECRIFRPPPHEVLAKTQSGQQWVAETTEKHTRVCGSERPGPNPAAR